MFFGFVLVIIGAILLLQRLHIISNTLSFWGYLWPVLIIALGVWMIVGKNKKRVC